MEAIIKNIEKYDNIRMARGLDLSRFSTQKRERLRFRDIGVSTTDFGEEWFRIEKEGKTHLAIFKTFTDSYALSIRHVRMYNEIICSILAKQMGVPCAEYESAHLKNFDGVVSYSVLKQNESMKSLSETFNDINLYLDRNFKSIVDASRILKEKGYRVNRREIVMDMFRVVVFDYLTLQSDRHGNNLAFIFNSEDNSVRLSPLFDNEFAFCGDAIKNQEITEYTMEELIKKHSYSAFFTMTECSKNRIENNVDQIAEYSRKYPEMGKIVKQMLESIDIRKAIEEMTNQGHEINQEYKEYLIEVVDYTKNALQERLSESIKIEDDTLEL